MDWIFRQKNEKKRSNFPSLPFVERKKRKFPFQHLHNRHHHSKGKIKRALITRKMKYEDKTRMSYVSFVHSLVYIKCHLNYIRWKEIYVRRNLFITLRKSVSFHFPTHCCCMRSISDGRIIKNAYALNNAP